MKLAIVGSTRLAGNAEAAALIERILDEYQPTLVISGGAPGIDTMAATAARARGIPVVEHLPVKPSWPYFKIRNRMIAGDCERLVRIVAQESKTYGSGWTRDRAREMGKPTVEYIIA